MRSNIPHDVYPYYPETIGDDPCHPLYSRYTWDTVAYRLLGFKTIIDYLSALNMIHARESWKRVLS